MLFVVFRAKHFEVLKHLGGAVGWDYVDDV